MTGLTTDPFVYMGAVVEIDIISQAMDTDPLEALGVLEACSHQFQSGSFGCNLSMTAHTSFGRGNAGKISFLDRGVTITAIKPQPTHMLLVAKKDRLLFSQANFCHVGRLDPKVNEPSQSDQDEYDSQEACPDDDIHALGE
jgi:hypothetical protein